MARTVTAAWLIVVCLFFVCLFGGDAFGAKKKRHPKRAGYPAPAEATSDSSDATAASTASTPTVAAPDAVPPAAATGAGTAVPATASAGTASAATPAATEAPADKRPPEWTNHISFGGGAIFYYFQPLHTQFKSNLELYFAYLRIDGNFGRFGLHFEPRFRDTRLRPFFEGPSWVEEAYAWMDAGPVTVKVGKIYSRLGLFWDDSFYGNVQLFDGLKLDPDNGVSIDGAFGDDRGISFVAQYFLVDGRTNLSFDTRDTISIIGARRRNMFIGRIDPFFNIGRLGRGRVGLSAEHFTADLPDGEHPVTRVAIDAGLDAKGFTGWVEWLHQIGESVNGFPYPAVPATATAPALPGRFSINNTYWLIGGEYTYKLVTLRYNYSRGRYQTVAVTESTHIPGVGVALHSNLILLTELVLWNRYAPEGKTVMDRSIDITLTGHF